LQQDAIITKIINDLVEKYYDKSWKLELREQIDKIIDDVLKTKAGGESIIFDTELRNIKEEVGKLYEIKY
jgi:hypothetical protein